jgi:aldehyde:ferredoxin oxidoreductase
MLGGYAGKFLWVNLAEGTLRTETPDEQLLRDWIGGYGVGARVLYDLIPPGIDPLGPENILGFVTGPLTGSPAPTGTRWTVVCKSPLTGGWGDANGSGQWGTALKQAGFDALFFMGRAAQPVYLYLEDGQAELRPANHLWGKDCYETDDWVKAELGKDVHAACIGPAGEQQALISGIVHAKGRIAARSGVGAVMGSKQLKLIAVRGTQPVPIANRDLAAQMKTKYLKEITSGTGGSDFYRQTGTPGYLPFGIKTGDSPTANWRNSSTSFGEPRSLEFVELLKYRTKRQACWRCPIGCWGVSRLEYQGENIETHQPEYETGAAFGSLTLNHDYPAIIKANEICNRYGLDTISAGSCVAFAMECYEHGIISAHDTGGIELQWGDPRAMIALLLKIARREDLGDLLALGVKRAADQLGPRAQPFAIHVGGQELPMHDPRFEPGLGIIYKIDATPGRHTQASQYTVPPGFKSERPGYGEHREQQAGRGRWLKEASCLCHTMAASGACLFGYGSTTVTFVSDFIAAVTGQPFTVDDMLLAGERIANIRQAFNVREGINAVTQPIPERAYGRPPLADGPTAGIGIQIEQMLGEHLEDMGWTPDAAIPTRHTLERLGLNAIARDLWGS